MPWEPPEEAFAAAVPVASPASWDPGTSYHAAPENDPAFKPIPSSAYDVLVNKPLNFGPSSTPIGPSGLLKTFGYSSPPTLDVTQGAQRNALVPYAPSEQQVPTQTPARQNAPEVQNVYYDTDTPQAPKSTSGESSTAKEVSWQPPESAFKTDTKSGAYLDDHLGGGLKGHGADFEAAGQKYGVDPALLASMSMFETTNGTSHVFRTRNNTGGITGPGYNGIGGNYRPFGSVAESIDEQAKMVAQYRDKHGLTTIPQIGARWAGVGEPNDPNNTNAEWPVAVSSNYRKITGTDYGGGAVTQPRTSTSGGWQPPAEAFAQTPSTQTPSDTGWSPPENAFSPRAQPVDVRRGELIVPPAAGAESYGASATTVPAAAPDPNAPPPGYSQTQIPVERATPVAQPEVRKALPVEGQYTTNLSPNQEQQFQQWVQKNKIPWQDTPNADYDMRGYWKAMASGDPNAQRAANLHFPDTWKTPFHQTFSNESIYAGPGAPHWEGGKLIDASGKVITDESKPAQTALPVGADQEDYSTTGAMIRPAGLTTGPVDPNDPYELQIRETQVNPDLNDAQKAWMVQSLRIQQAKAEPRVERAQLQPETALPVGAEAESYGASAAMPRATSGPSFGGTGATSGGASVQWEEPEGTADNVTRALISSVPQGALKWFEGLFRTAASLPQLPGIDSDEDYKNGQKKLTTAADWFKNANDQIESKINPDVQQNPVVGTARGALEFVPAMVLTALVPEIGGAGIGNGFIAKTITTVAKNIPFAVASIPNIAADSFDRGKAELANRTDLTEEQKNEIANKKMLIDSGVNFSLFTSLPGVQALMPKGSLAGLLSRYISGAVMLGGSQLESNLSTKALTNPKQDPWAGVLQATASGVAMTGISHALERITKGPQTLAELTRPSLKETAKQPPEFDNQGRPITQRPTQQTPPEPKPGPVVRQTEALPTQGEHFPATGGEWRELSSEIELGQRYTDENKVVSTYTVGKAYKQYDLPPDVGLRLNPDTQKWEYRKQGEPVGQEPTPQGRNPYRPSVEFTPPKITSPQVEPYVGITNLREAATKAAGNNAMHQSIAAIVPENDQLAFVDQADGVKIGRHDFDVSNTGGIYHPGAETAFISSTATDPAGMILHEATHAALRHSVQDGVFDDAYNQARVKAGNIGNQPEHIQYGLSTPDEFVSAAVADPRFQRLLQGGGNNKPWLSFLQGIKDATGVKETRPGETNRAILDAVQAKTVPPTTKEGVPVYSALPGNVPVARGGRTGVGLFGKGWANWLAKVIIPNRDMVAAFPHTEKLVAAIDKWRAQQGELQGRTAQLDHLFKQLEKRNPGLANEVHQILLKQENGDPLPARISPQAREWIAKSNNGLYREIGTMMRSGGFDVALPGGGTRKFIGAPSNVIPAPRVLRPDAQRMLEGPIYDSRGNLTPAAAKLYAEGRQTINKNTGRPYFEKPQDLEDWVRQYNLEKRQGPMTTGLEKARVVKYPSFFYTYHPQTMIDTLGRQSTEIARLNAFGQKIGGKQDLFDKTVNEINDDLSLTGAQKKRAIAAIEQLKNNVYQLNQRSDLERIARGVSSAGFAGNPLTSSKIGLSMIANSAITRGLGRTLLGIFDRIFHPGQSMDELRRLGLSSNKILNQGDDPYSVRTAQNKATNLFTGVLNWAGHAFAQDLGKSVTARASRSFLEDYAIKRLQRDPGLKNFETRKIAQDIERRGMNPKDFMVENVPQAIRDRYVRESVNDFQTAYRPEDYPGWTSGKLGFAFQFGHWSYTAARMITRDMVIPLAQATAKGDGLVAGRYLLQMAAIPLYGALASEGIRKLQELFGAQSKVASVGEIWNAFARNNPAAAQMVLSRLGQDIIGSPVIGLFGEGGNFVAQLGTGRADRAHMLNPSVPAAIGYLNNIYDAVTKLSQEGWKLSHQQWARLGQNVFSGGKELYNLANTLGVPLPGHTEAMGHRDSDFVKSRLDVFYDQHPEFDKRSKGGNFPNNTHTPYLQDLNDAMVAGKVQDVRQIMSRMKIDLHLTPKELQTSVRESVDSHRPIPGGTVNAPFIKWAKRTLTPDELQRAHNINRVYERTAEQAGINVKGTD